MIKNSVFLFQIIDFLPEIKAGQVYIQTWFIMIDGISRVIFAEIFKIRRISKWRCLDGAISQLTMARLVRCARLAVWRTLLTISPYITITKVPNVKTGIFMIVSPEKSGNRKLTKSISG